MLQLQFSKPLFPIDRYLALLLLSTCNCQSTVFISKGNQFEIWFERTSRIHHASYFFKPRWSAHMDDNAWAEDDWRPIYRSRFFLVWNSKIFPASYRVTSLRFLLNDNCEHVFSICLYSEATRSFVCHHHYHHHHHYHRPGIRSYLTAEITLIRKT